jgi:hypothetical protein
MVVFVLLECARDDTWSGDASAATTSSQKRRGQSTPTTKRAVASDTTMMTPPQGIGGFALLESATTDAFFSTT